MKSKRTLFWEEHDAELRHMVEVEHLMGKEVAARLGVTVDAVTGRAARIGIKWHGKPLFWELKKKKKLQKAAQERKAVKKMLEPEKDYWASRHGWGFPPYGHCVFPFGDVSRPNFSFCGEPVIQEGKPYCPTHQKLSRGVKPHGL